MATEKFCLRWNDFESNVSTAFRELREEKDFFDVTIACDDNQVQAHKVILSACSPFFRNILRRNPHAHPLLYLKGVKYQELLSVLNFMYQGEVNVAQEELNSFLAVAEDLRVKGLTQNSSGKSEPPPPPPPSRQREVERDPVPPPKRPRPPNIAPKSVPVAAAEFSTPSYDDDEIQEVAPAVKAEPVAAVDNYEQQQQGGTVALGDESYEYGDGAYDEAQYGEYDNSYYDPNTGQPLGDGNKGGFQEEILQYLNKVSPTEFSCLVCHYKASQKHHVLNHIEAKHLKVAQYHCNICGKECPTKNAMYAHKSRTHSLK